mmetsp:Transcript_50286/g.96051  ORF Transcript_50286/g.96051 Transcript_50286/m.96051 type:complete len:190 (+) Transcript_50286:99-668(+)
MIPETLAQFRGSVAFQNHKRLRARPALSTSRCRVYAAARKLGVVVVDHGSRRAESNELFEKFVDLYREQTRRSIVEAAHMELAEPTISDAFDKCVAQGATTVVVSPYFLSPGRHWQQDIPSLTRAAAAKHPEVQFMVSAPIGLHQLVAQVIDERLEHCMAHAAGDAEACEMCAGTDRCKLETMEDQTSG